MNWIGRSLARELLLSSPSPSRKFLLQQLLVQHSIAVVQNHSSPYSTSSTNTSPFKNQYTEKNPYPKPQQQPPPPPPPKGSAEMVERQTQVGSRPSEIPWQPKVANSVNLIGHVQIPVQFEATPDGKYWAGTIISQQDGDSSDSPPFWIPIIFEGDLAHIANYHLKAKDYVYIVGQLSADPPPFPISQGQANVQVMVRSINFVQRSSQMKKSVTQHNLEQDNSGTVSDLNDDGDPTLNSWKELVKNPKKWQDFRENKRNGLLKQKHPDFKHKDSGLSLWLDTAPEWVLSELKGLEFYVQFAKSEGDDSWNDLLENPDKWWDKRAQKVNEKSPDFIHKVTGSGLWLSGSPSWVSSRLPPLNLGDDTWKDLVENPDKWWDNRADKANEKSPDFKHKVTGARLWLRDSPSWVSSKFPPVNRGDDLWRDLVENPDNWWDNRANKANKKSPDFKHKVTGAGLWQRGSPSWVSSRLPPLKSAHTATFCKTTKPLSETT
ncbi:protein OSB3, chloroplastic/mitochondrial-like isoform X1 [Actinidia eriantha]|uniref:protein OSB3, chloroplastic/mitochondrial-like isoform X1 n=1 Tax=Actinidia eriantha TaxID=165200 RepID=UPI00258483D3|nr:protein OSB3, chloroplastic/mitochondrial-like isoform X1 [Actinidia eriantha]